MKERGLSPVVATVLLVAMVVVIALIIFMWFRGMSEETITKFDSETNVKTVCNDVYFEASYSGDTLYISNSGSVPIFDLEMKVYGAGSHETLDLRKDYETQWPEAGLDQGRTFTGDVSGDVDGSEEKIVLVPVLLGESDEGKKTYVCNEKEHGVSVSL